MWGGLLLGGGDYNGSCRVYGLGFGRNGNPNGNDCNRVKKGTTMRIHSFISS